MFQKRAFGGRGTIDRPSHAHLVMFAEAICLLSTVRAQQNTIDEEKSDKVAFEYLPWSAWDA